MDANDKPTREVKRKWSLMILFLLNRLGFRLNASQ